MASKYLALIPLFPLVAFLINSLVLRTKAKVHLSGTISFLGSFVSFVLVCMLFPTVKSQGQVIAHLWNWASFGSINFDVTFMIDEVSMVLAFMVSGIGSLITMFSIGYMDHDERPGKFFSYMSLFIFSMLLLTLAENFIVLFFGWEGVGLCSYLLIGFWYTDIDKAIAGRKAFITNRIGDFGVVLGIVGYALVFNSVSFVDLKNPVMDVILANKGFLVISSLFLVLGVTGKSAQMPLYVWLPDAMAGPTPVSALIHAATMVTAGIFLLLRLSNVIVHLDVVMEVIAWIGALTALVAALIAITQRDIKRVLAYSTVSQIGYMMLACGVGAFSAGMFHVFTHAFFKALLFLGSGAVIYSLHHEQDMMKMGGLRKKLPITFTCFVIALLAISGIPGFSGFFSKDEIIWLTLNKPGTGTYLYGIAVFTALLTAFYMTRLVMLTFFGTPRHHDDPHHPIKEAPKVMTIPLMILAVFSFGIGWIGLPHFMSHSNPRMFQHFLERVVPAPREAIYSAHTEHLLMIGTVLAIMLSMSLAYFIYIKKEETKLAEKLKFALIWPWKASFNKFMVDELYEVWILNPVKWFADFLVKFVEKWIVDGAVRLMGTLAIQGGVLLNTVRPLTLESNILLIILGMTAFLAYVISIFA